MKISKIGFVLFLLIFCVVDIISEEFKHCGSEMDENLFVPPISEIAMKLAEIQSSNVKFIPVVVHVIYKNSSENISDAQIISQINVLNEDFRRMGNTPGYNSHPDGADTKYEFRLAKQDPNGNPTNGITRNYSNISKIESTQKIEELTLYIIQQEKRIADLENHSKGE